MNINNNSIVDLRVGDSGVNKGFLRDKLVYESAPPLPSIDEVWVPLGFQWSSDHTGGQFMDKTITSIPLADTSVLTNMDNMFIGCDKLTTIPKLNVSNVTSMRGSFNYCMALTEVDLDTSNVQFMDNAFDRCSELTKVNLKLDKVTSMEDTFYYCDKLATVGHADVSNVTSMRDAYFGCNELVDIYLKGLKCDIVLTYSYNKLSLESLLYIIRNVQVVTPDSSYMNASGDLFSAIDSAVLDEFRSKGWIDTWA